MGFVPHCWPNAHAGIAAWYIFCLPTSSFSAAGYLTDSVSVHIQEKLSLTWEWLGGDRFAKQVCPGVRAAVTGASWVRLSSHGQKSVCAGFFPTLLLLQVFFKSGERTGNAVSAIAMVSGPLIYC